MSLVRFCCHDSAPQMQGMAITQIKPQVDPSEQLWMPNTIGSTKQLNDEMPIELQEMAKAIEALPARYRDAVAPAMQRVVQCSTRRRRILNLVQEALSQLRLDMKYLIFDLEATRRERDEFKEMLDQDGRM